MTYNNQDRLGYKLTSLGWIPYEWELKKLKEVAKVQGGFAFDSKKFSSVGKFQVVKMSNVYNGILDLQRSASFLSSISTQESLFLLKKGDILISLTGTIGKRDYGYTYIIVDEQNLLLNQRVARITSIQGKSNELYLTYELKTKRLLDQFFFSARGGTGNQANVGTGDLELLKIALPPLPEQHKIAGILRTWDEAIIKTQQLITQIQKRNKGLTHHLLIPNPNWLEVKMSDVFERVTKKNIEGNKNVVTISAQRGFVRQEDFFKKIIASDILDNYFLVERGEFCYNKSYSNGYDWGAIKRLNDFDKAVVTSLYICFRIIDYTSFSGNFFEHFFESGKLENGLAKIAHEGGRAHGLLNVTPTDFFNLKIIIPELSEQNRIEKILQVAASELKLYQLQLVTLQKEKKGLMQKLLTGEIRVKIDNK